MDTDSLLKCGGTKFDHILTALPQEVLNSVKKIIRLPVATPDRYKLLKESLMLSFGKSVAQKHADLIQFAAAKDPILDQKPSDLFTLVRDSYRSYFTGSYRPVALGVWIEYL